jgi:hypothetical protein
MGASNSKEAVVCIDCDRKTQKDLPEDNRSSASRGNPCEETYTRVTTCMDKSKGQISSCVKEWDEFKECHAQVSQK